MGEPESMKHGNCKWGKKGFKNDFQFSGLGNGWDMVLFMKTGVREGRVGLEGGRIGPKI